MFNILPVLFFVCGGYLLFRLRFFFILHPFRTLRATLDSVKGIDTAKSLTLALAGTLGVGNVFGVCLGIIIGGSGSVFWMIISSIFASVLKYSEVTLAHDRSTSGLEGSGMMYALGCGSLRLGKYLSYIYAAFCFLLALFMGSALQCGTVSETVSELFDTPPVVIGIIFACVVFISIVGGVKIIEKITLFAIPISTIVYIILTLTVIVLNIERLPSVMSDILSSAFRPRSGVGGILGFILSPSVGEGFSRGLLSNEAGCGTSSMAHTRSGILNPASAGLMGIVEVIFDTVILCSLTAFSVLTAVPDPGAYSAGMSLILTAVGSTLGYGCELLLLVLVFIFAYATVVCWYYYATLSLGYLFGGRFTFLVLPLYLIFCLLGAALDNKILVFITDACMLPLALSTVLLLMKSSDRIVFLSERGGVLPRKYFKGILSLRGRGTQAPRASTEAHARSSNR